MKRIALMALIALFTISYAAAQNNEGGKPRFDPKEFQQRMETELTRQAGLSAEEAKVFFPIYKEMKEKLRGIGQQIHELKKKCQKQDETACTTTIAKIKQLQVESAQTEQAYYRRLVETVPATKVFAVMKAEDDFHRRMVQAGRGRSAEDNRAPKGPHPFHREPHEDSTR